MKSTELISKLEEITKLESSLAKMKSQKNTLENWSNMRNVKFEVSNHAVGTILINVPFLKEAVVKTIIKEQNMINARKSDLRRLIPGIKIN